MNGITTPLPLVETAKVKRGPHKLVVAEHPYVIWRAQGRFFAASAICPHRGADLSAGRVCGDVLECPYHGWTLDTQGGLYSPFEAKAKGQQQVFALTERFGLLWLNGDEAYFEALARTGGEFFGPMTFAFAAPLHVTVDSFCDGAHVPFVHARNGANRSQVDETTFDWDEDETGITLRYDYAQRPGTLMSVFNGFRKTRWFTTARIEFRPIRVQYTIYWYLPASKRALNGVNGNTYFFYPGEKGRTTSICLVFQRDIPAHLRPFRPILVWAVRKFTQDLIAEDLAMASKILATDEAFAGFRLEKFDAPIFRVRKRLLETQEFQPRA